jgi:hypothetical protein
VDKKLYWGESTRHPESCTPGDYAKKLFCCSLQCSHKNVRYASHADLANNPLCLAPAMIDAISWLLWTIGQFNPYFPLFKPPNPDIAYLEHCKGGRLGGVLPLRKPASRCRWLPSKAVRQELCHQGAQAVHPVAVHREGRRGCQRRLQKSLGLPLRPLTQLLADL